jgi:hypothetical protein
MTVKLFEGCYGRTLGGRVLGPAALIQENEIFEFSLSGENYKQNGCYFHSEKPCDDDIISL